jgi:hypothetical protein
VARGLGGFDHYLRSAMSPLGSAFSITVLSIWKKSTGMVYRPQCSLIGPSLPIRLS